MLALVQYVSYLICTLYYLSFIDVSILLVLNTIGQYLQDINVCYHSQSTVKQHSPLVRHSQLDPRDQQIGQTAQTSTAVARSIFASDLHATTA